MKAELKHVIVTDTHRGVVYGRLVELDRVLRVAKLVDARHIFQFALQGEAPGLFGLATHGPAPNSKISPVPVAALEVMDVSKVIDCSEAAIEAFKGAAWK